MITAVHALLYSDDAEATRRFLAEVLRWPSVDAGGGWLIFGTGPSELGVHPTSGPGYHVPRHHEISLVCDDLTATVRDLRARGATFLGSAEDRGFGLAVDLEVPGAGPILLYQPHHRLATEGAD